MSVAPSALAKSAANVSREQLLAYARAYQPGQQVYHKFATRNEQQENDLFIRTLDKAPGSNIAGLRNNAVTAVKTGSAYMTLGSLGSTGLLFGAAWLGSHAAFAGHGVLGLACVGAAFVIGLPLGLRGAQVRSRQQHFVQQLDDWTVWLAKNGAPRPAAQPAAVPAPAVPAFAFGDFMQKAAAGR